MNDVWIPMPRYKLRKSLVKRLIKQYDLKGNSLELGYGAGDMLLLYAKAGMVAEGYDFSSMAYDNASYRINQTIFKDQITLLEQVQAVKEQYYHCLFAFEVLEHIEEDEAALLNWKHYLKANGYLIMSVPAHERKWGASDIAVGHYRRYEKHALEKKLTKAGFKVHTVWSYGYPLTIALDYALHKNAQKQLDAAKITDKASLSKLSGIDRKPSLANKILASDLFLSPFYLLQSVFLNTDLGSGYLVVAQKQ